MPISLQRENSRVKLILIVMEFTNRTTIYRLNFVSNEKSYKQINGSATNEIVINTVLRRSYEVSLKFYLIIIRLDINCAGLVTTLYIGITL